MAEKSFDQLYREAVIKSAQKKVKKPAKERIPARNTKSMKKLSQQHETEYNDFKREKAAFEKKYANDQNMHVGGHRDFMESEKRFYDSYSARHEKEHAARRSEGVRRKMQR